MRSDSILLIISLCIASFFVVAHRPAKTNDTYTKRAIGNINQQFQQDLLAFNENAQTFKVMTNTISSEILYKNTQLQYRALRDAYKRVEYIIEYVDKELTDKNLNGAPLPKLEKKVAEINILQPKGLQVIDELMGDTFDELNTKKLYKTAAKLATDASQITLYFKNKKLSDRQFFEATRLAIIRITTLGITGFDTPGTITGIEDAKQVLITLQQGFDHYRPELKSIGHTKQYTTLHKLFNKGIKQTKNADFNTFDRLRFIKQVTNPLYKKIKEIHLALDYETIGEVTQYLPAVNYNADNMFAADFLDPFYYVSLEDNEKTKQMAAIGKLLFYDPILSHNNKMSCASCHAPKKAFTDGFVLSKSNTGASLKRNAMTLNYTVYATGFFHDIRTRKLEDQFEHVVLSDDEFNSSYEQIVSKLLDSETYTRKFEEAFPEQKEAITFNNIDYALAAYVMQLNTFDNPVDQYLQDKTATIDAQVQSGFNLFTGKAACATCHFTPLYAGNVPPFFKDTEVEVLGVPDHKDTPTVFDDDLGRYGNGRTHDVAPFYKGAFKTPTLRNIALTGPYMHNGVFDTLEEVMDFYNKGGGAGQGMALEHQTLAPDPLELTESEIEAIIAFMKSLTDTKKFTPVTEIPRDFKDNNLNERALLLK